jgi:hypothetical protein
MKEKLLRALNSSDLEDQEHETHVHLVASLGATQIGPRKHLSIGALLLHIRGGHQRFYPRVIDLTAAYVVSRAKRDRWQGITPERARQVAVEALHHYFNPLCMVCHGVGKIGEPGQVIVLCSRKDGGCGGTGKKPEKWKGWMERVKDVLSVLGAWEGYASSGARRQAGRTY